MERMIKCHTNLDDIIKLTNILLSGQSKGGASELYHKIGLNKNQDKIPRTPLVELR